MNLYFKSWCLSFIILFLSNGSYLFGQIASDANSSCLINGRIISKSDNSGIAYVTIASVLNKSIGAVTDEHGYFELKLKGKCIDSVFISRVGYTDTIICLTATQKFYEIALQEKIVQLDEITVSSSKLVRLVVGEDLVKAIGSRKTFSARIVQSNQPGTALGNFYEVRGLKGFIDSVFILIQKEFLPCKLSLNIFCFNGSLKDYKLTPLNGWRSLMKEPVFIEINEQLAIIPLKEVSFSECDYLIFSFVPLLITDIKDGYQYGMVSYSSKNKSAKRFFMFGNRFAVLPPTDGLIAMYSILSVEK
ncbi:MAG: carboxypeptidase-like regulatory domain-containing protein [Cyclobacteriaceae bacterium]|nr:carboxypeptidase-like regulatory domain-containing protein [Cyclobacteriaceae bacterium]